MPETKLATRTPGALAQYDPTQFNVLLPETRVYNAPPGTIASEARLVVNQSEDAKEIYPITTTQMGLSGVVLQKFSALAGISVVSKRRVDNRTKPHFYAYEVVGRMRMFDGTVRQEIGTKELDLRETAEDGEAGTQFAAIVREAGDKDPAARLANARKFGSQICASIAENAMIRKILGLKHAYTKQELEKPFVVPRLILDAKDPDVKRATISVMTGAIEHMYPEPHTVEVAAETPAIEAPKQIEAAPKETPKADPEIAKRFHAVREIARGAGCSTEAFGALCKAETGKARSSELTLGDVAKIETAVSAEIDKRAAAQENTADVEF